MNELDAMRQRLDEGKDRLADVERERDESRRELAAADKTIAKLFTRLTFALARAERLADALRRAVEMFEVIQEAARTGDFEHIEGWAASAKAAALADAPAPQTDAEMDEPDRVSECRHGTEGAAADPSVCSACAGEADRTDAPGTAVTIGDPGAAFRPRDWSAEANSSPNGLADIMGKWPGDKTDDEVREAPAKPKPAQRQPTADEALLKGGYGVADAMLNKGWVLRAEYVDGGIELQAEHRLWAEGYAAHGVTLSAALRSFAAMTHDDTRDNVPRTGVWPGRTPLPLAPTADQPAPCPECERLRASREAADFDDEYGPGSAWSEAQDAWRATEDLLADAQAECERLRERIEELDYVVRSAEATKAAGRSILRHCSRYRTALHKLRDRYTHYHELAGALMEEQDAVQAECERLRGAVRRLAYGVDALQVGHEAPWTAADEGDGYWAVEDANGRRVWECQDGEYEGEQSAEKRMSEICEQVNTAALEASSILRDALTPDRPAEPEAAPKCRPPHGTPRLGCWVWECDCLYWETVDGPLLCRAGENKSCPDRPAKEPEPVSAADQQPSIETGSALHDLIAALTRGTDQVTAELLEAAHASLAGDEDGPVSTTD